MPFNEDRSNGKQWLLRPTKSYFWKVLLTVRKIIDPARIRTWNPLIRSQMPYPLGHGAGHGTVVVFLNLYLMLTIVYTL